MRNANRSDVQCGEWSPWAMPPGRATGAGRYFAGTTSWQTGLIWPPTPRRWYAAGRRVGHATSADEKGEASRRSAQRSGTGPFRHWRPRKSARIGTHRQRYRRIKALVPEPAPTSQRPHPPPNTMKPGDMQGFSTRVSDGTRTRDRLDHKHKLYPRGTGYCRAFVGLAEVDAGLASPRIRVGSGRLRHSWDLSA
jgi:hypothetical protein